MVPPQPISLLSHFFLSYTQIYKLLCQNRNYCGTSKTLSVRDSAGVLELLKVKKMLSSAFPSSSSNTICSLTSAASAAAAAAAASLSFRASSIKLWRLPTNLGDCFKREVIDSMSWFKPLSEHTDTTTERGNCQEFSYFRDISVGYLMGALYISKCAWEQQCNQGKPTTKLSLSSCHGTHVVNISSLFLRAFFYVNMI